ncbi:MAG: hypothetical protein ACYC3I_24270 [Gemmataceae bacterium]
MEAPIFPYRAATSGSDASLRQGEILSNVVRLQLDLKFLGTDEQRVEPVEHGYAVILTQDCDLEQDFKARQRLNKPDKLLPNVFFCHLATAQQLRGAAGITTDIWKRISQNKDERYHFLQKIEVDLDGLQQGLPELGIDFKHYFTIPTDEIYKRIEMKEANRRCVLVSPYLEHLSSRFAYFLSRVALPQDHFSEPAAAQAP